MGMDLLVMGLARESHEWDYEALSARLPVRMLRRWLAWNLHEHHLFEAERMESEVEARRLSR